MPRVTAPYVFPLPITFLTPLRAIETIANTRNVHLGSVSFSPVSDRFKRPIYHPVLRRGISSVFTFHKNAQPVACKDGVLDSAMAPGH